MTFAMHVARLVLSHLTSKCEVIFPSKKEVWYREREEYSRSRMLRGVDAIHIARPPE
jgi:hypothetical protein